MRLRQTASGRFSQRHTLAYLGGKPETADKHHVPLYRGTRTE